MRHKTGILAAVAVLVWMVAGNVTAKDLPKTSAGKVILKVQGMTCTACEAKVEKALQKVQGVEKADANFKTGEVVVRVAGKVDRAALKKAVDETGFKVVDKEMKAVKARTVPNKDCDGKGCCSGHAKSST